MKACEQIYAPLLSRKIITPEERSILFQNQDEILQLNKQICGDIMAATEVPRNTQASVVGALFKRFAPEILKIYGPYCANLVISRRMRLKLCKRENFQQFLTEAQNDARANKQDLKSYLIKPLQR